MFHLQQERRRKWRHFSHRITFSNPMLEPLKERTRDTCETRIRGGPPEATGLSLVTQPGYSVSASTVFSFSYDPFKQKFWIVWILPGNFGRTLQIFSTSRAIKAVQMLLHRSKVIKCPYCTVPENRTAFPLPSCPGQASPKRLFQSRRWVRSKSHNGRSHW